jgi:predicted phosphodiesterase
MVVAHLILADMHGNREALEAVLAYASGRYDQIVCLGYLLGDCADPNFVVDWARANTVAIVPGNHDRITVDDASLDATSLDAYRTEVGEGALWTRRALSAENLDYLLKMGPWQAACYGAAVAIAIRPQPANPRKLRN